MQRVLGYALVILCLTGCSSTQHPLHHPQWQTLGGDWQTGKLFIAPEPAAQPTFLYSKATYADFDLSVEFMPDAAVNSGVFVRCQDPSEFTPFNCYEANIWDEHPRQEFRTGSIVARVAPPLAHVDTIGKWNNMRVTADGARIEVYVNDLLTARLENAEFPEGHIALQWGGEGSIQFRNLKLLVR